MVIERKARGFLALLVIAGASFGMCPASAQLAASKPGEALRPLFATPQDIREGQELANETCASCHGAKGVSTNPGIPNLAGQRAPYLYLELKAYQTGGRTDAQMVNKVKFLSDDALVKVAAYYGNLDPAQPVKTNAADIVDPVQAGKAAAASCVGCHGETGVSTIPGTPSLSGEEREYLVAAMKAYKDGQRKNETMKTMVANLSDTDMNHIALFFALQKPTRTQIPAKGDTDAGKAATAACKGCHGELGVSGNPATPSLAGQNEAYLVDALQSYKNGTRHNDTMKGLASSLSKATMTNVAAYYAGLEPKPANVRKPLSAGEWAQKCDRCHGINGNSAQPGIPALAGQHMEYLAKVLHEYQTRVRRNSEMAAMSDVLSADDIKGLAQHYSQQKARAVVLVTIPAQ